ncbi:MAG TPA: Crp/Fnr family transcriptional regulator [Candidatus Sulfomarinibacteraceae bacterium]|jgi:CRP-like cAMP-binding protein|nr:Crp/Fnr family transcriptional regulator [Candidatus Sulfomarinibacteraceae bacterium]
MSERIRELLTGVELFSELADNELDDLAGLAQVKKIGKDVTIFHAGDPADAVYVVASGRVKVVITSSDGKEFILTVLGAGQVFGEMALLESAPRSASVVTLSAVELLAINRADFQRLIDSNPRISHQLLAILSRRLRRANAKMESLAYMDVAGRLARYLLDLARDHGQRLGNGWVVVRRPTHSDIAHSIGTSRETVSRLINEFEEGFGLVNKGKFTYIRENLLE